MLGKGRLEFAGPRERRFERGDVKYLLLDLLKDKPRHGYELIRALEERFGGLYAPSPGAVYPTLQMLEDLGYVTATQRDGKKVYAITADGQRFLAERAQVVEDIWARTSGGWDPTLCGELQAMMQELADLAHVVGRRAGWQWANRQRVRRMREVIARTRRDIETILAEEGP